MPVKTRVGHGALYYTAHPGRDDIIVEEIRDDVWLVMGDYITAENSLALYLEDLQTAIDFMEHPDDGDNRRRSH